MSDILDRRSRPGPRHSHEPARQEKRADAADVLGDGGRDRRYRAQGRYPLRGDRRGPDVFCAGNDIGDFMKAAQGGGLGQPILDFLHALVRCEKPVVAAVNGNAVGVGTTMLLHCDYVVAGSAARLSTPFVGLGLVPEAASSLVAPKLMGHARAFALLVMGLPLSAEEAKEAGIVNAVVAPDATDAAALAAAEKIAALPAQGVLMSRRLMRGSVDEIIKRIDDEAEAFKTRLQSQEAQAAFMAFLNRKK